MLKIRLTRTGKKSQPSFRIVIAENSKAVKRKYLELLGHYVPSSQPKKIDINKERIEYWISKGAQPSDTVAAILKGQGLADMDKYMEPRDKKKKKKGEKPEEDAPKDAPKEAKSDDKPAEDKPAKEEAPKEEAPKEEKPAEEPAKEEKPQE